MMIGTWLFVANYEPLLSKSKFETFNYVLIYRLYLIGSGLYKLSSEKLEEKCSKIVDNTQIENSTFSWNGQNVKFTTNIKLKKSNIVRKFSIEEGYNGEKWVVYVKRFGKIIFEIEQPNGEKKCPYELYDQRWTHLKTGYTFTKKPINCPVHRSSQSELRLKLGLKPMFSEASYRKHFKSKSDWIEN